LHPLESATFAPRAPLGVFHSALATLRFPSAITLGGWLGGALLGHFAIMRLLVANFLVYVGLNIASGRLRRKRLPISFKLLATDLLATLRGTHQYR